MQLVSELVLVRASYDLNRMKPLLVLYLFSYAGLKTMITKIIGTNKLLF